MSEDEWIGASIDKAKGDPPLVGASVRSRVRKLLEDTLSDGSAARGTLKQIASDLLDLMSSESEQEQ